MQTPKHFETPANPPSETQQFQHLTSNQRLNDQGTAMMRLKIPMVTNKNLRFLFAPFFCFHLRKKKRFFCFCGSDFLQET